jgi:hypothetical protein
MAACGGGSALAVGKTPKAALPGSDLQILVKSRCAAEGSAPGTRKKAPVAVETFRKTLCERLHQKQIPLEASVHLWVMDEMRFGLQPVTRRLWTLPGVKVVVAEWNSLPVGLSRWLANLGRHHPLIRNKRDHAIWSSSSMSFSMEDREVFGELVFE